MDVRPGPGRDPLFCYWDYYEPVARHSKEMIYRFSVKATHYDKALELIDEVLRRESRPRAIGWDIKRVESIPREPY